MSLRTERYITREERRRDGRALRDKLRRVDQGKFALQARKFNPVELMNADQKSRLPELMPLKNARMTLNPFSFYRGAAPLMAADFANMPNTGMLVQICGDAHVQNLGAFGGGPEGHLIFDINDFDETIRAPWEWDVKRMAASLVLAGREAQNTEAECKDAVLEFARTYREFMLKFSELPTLELARYLVKREVRVSPARAVLRKAELARPLDNLAKLTVQNNGQFTIKESKDPIFGAVVQQPIEGAQARIVLDALPGYTQTLQPERRHLFQQYTPVDVGYRAVGTGSVGTRDFIVLMFGGAADDPMFLQLKQELPSVYAPYVPKNVPPRHHGQRVVEGVRRMLVQFDPFLGWATMDGVPYLVCPLRDYKAGIGTTDLVGKALVEYAQVCGELLSKGHACSGDPCMLAGYLGRSDRIDKALVNFAVDYADQTDRDHEAWQKAIAEGRVKALKDVRQKSVQHENKKESKKKR